MVHKFCLMCLIALLAMPAYAMRCAKGLAVEGDSQYRVLLTCGQPDFETTSYLTRYRNVGSYPYGHGQEITVRVDKWTYNRGSRRLLYTLEFVDGILVDITTDQGYGR